MRKLRLLIVIPLLIAFCGLSVGIVNSAEITQASGKILIDLSHAERITIDATVSPNLDTSKNDRIYSWQDWADAMRKEGYTLKLLTKGPITSNVLKDYDLLIVAEPDISNAKPSLFSSDEAKAISGFVKSGNSLLLSGQSFMGGETSTSYFEDYNSSYSNSGVQNDLLKKLDSGVRFTTSPQNSNDGDIVIDENKNSEVGGSPADIWITNGNTSNPVWDNVPEKKFVLFHGSSIDITKDSAYVIAQGDKETFTSTDKASVMYQEQRERTIEELKNVEEFGHIVKKKGSMPVVIAEDIYGCGKIIAYGDASAWQDKEYWGTVFTSSQYHETELAHSMIKYLIQKEVGCNSTGGPSGKPSSASPVSKPTTPSQSGAGGSPSGTGPVSSVKTSDIPVIVSVPDAAVFTSACENKCGTIFPNSADISVSPAVDNGKAVTIIQPNDVDDSGTRSTSGKTLNSFTTTNCGLGTTIKGLENLNPSGVTTTADVSTGGDSSGRAVGTTTDTNSGIDVTVPDANAVSSACQSKCGSLFGNNANIVNTGSISATSSTAKSSTIASDSGRAVSSSGTGKTLNSLGSSGNVATLDTSADLSVTMPDANAVSSACQSKCGSLFGNNANIVNTGSISATSSTAKSSTIASDSGRAVSSSGTGKTLNSLGSSENVATLDTSADLSVTVPDANAVSSACQSKCGSLFGNTYANTVNAGSISATSSTVKASTVSSDSGRAVSSSNSGKTLNSLGASDSITTADVSTGGDSSGRAVGTTTDTNSGIDVTVPDANVVSSACQSKCDSMFGNSYANTVNAGSISATSSTVKASTVSSDSGRAISSTESGKTLNSLGSSSADVATSDSSGRAVGTTADTTTDISLNVPDAKTVSSACQSKCGSMFGNSYANTVNAGSISATSSTVKASTVSSDSGRAVSSTDTGKTLNSLGSSSTDIATSDSSGRSVGTTADTSGSVNINFDVNSGDAPTYLNCLYNSCMDTCPVNTCTDSCESGTCAGNCESNSCMDTCNTNSCTDTCAVNTCVDTCETETMKAITTANKVQANTITSEPNNERAVVSDTTTPVTAQSFTVQGDSPSKLSGETAFVVNPTQTENKPSAVVVYVVQPTTPAEISLIGFQNGFVFSTPTTAGPSGSVFLVKSGSDSGSGQSSGTVIGNFASSILKPNFLSNETSGKNTVNASQNKTNITKILTPQVTVTKNK